jgi:hypothetical protein
VLRFFAPLPRPPPVLIIVLLIAVRVLIIAVRVLIIAVRVLIILIVAVRVLIIAVRVLIIAVRVLIIAVRVLIIAVWKSVLQYFAPVLLRPPLESASKSRAPTAAVGVYDPSRLSQQELTACHVLSTIVTGFEQIWDVGDCDDEEL